MSERILAEGAIEVGHHTTAQWLGMTVNTDTVLATAWQLSEAEACGDATAQLLPE